MNKVEVSELRERADALGDEPQTDNQQADAIDRVAIAIYMSGAAISERLEAVERAVRSVDVDKG